MSTPSFIGSYAHQYQELVEAIQAILMRTGSSAAECKVAIEEIHELIYGED